MWTYSNKNWFEPDKTRKLFSTNRSDEKPDLAVVKEKVHKLVWRDAHQLFLRLEAGVREFVLEIKLKLIELLQKQAKNPSLAQDFTQCNVSNHF